MKTNTTETEPKQAVEGYVLKINFGWVSFNQNSLVFETEQEAKEVQSWYIAKWKLLCTIQPCNSRAAKTIKGIMATPELIEWLTK